MSFNHKNLDAGHSRLWLGGVVSIALHGSAVAWFQATAPTHPIESGQRLIIKLESPAPFSQQKLAPNSVDKIDTSPHESTHAESDTTVTRKQTVKQLEKTSELIAIKNTSLSREVQKIESSQSQTTKPTGNEVSSTTENTPPELLNLLHIAINHKKRYPLAALRQQKEGSAQIQFKLQPDGQINTLNLLSSSGHSSLDRAALAAVRNITPFTPAAKYLQTAKQLQVNIVFKI